MKDIKDFEKYYSISKDGRVFSKRRNIYLKWCLVSKGRYRAVLLTVNYKYKMKSIHRLVAEAYIENPENKPQVNHIDGDRFNNCVDNLEWVTAKENVRHAIDTGLSNPVNQFTGGFDERRSKLTKHDVLDVRARYAKGEALREISKDYNVHESNIGRACKGHSFKDIIDLA